jgi:hypothetical protein
MTVTSGTIGPLESQNSRANPQLSSRMRPHYRWLLIVLVSLGVFIGSLYAASLAERWAFPGDYVGDRFIPIAIILGIVSWYFAARWTRGPTNR